MKKKSPTWYRKKLVAKAKEEAKRRDGYRCQYCGCTKEQGYQIHGSHILPEGAYPLMSVEPYNIIALCAVHHLAGMRMMARSKEPSWHGDPTLFAEWFEKKWPGRVKELREMNKEKATHLIDWKKKWESHE